MDVHVVDILLAVRAGIDDDAEPSFRRALFCSCHGNSLFFGQFRNQRHHFTKQCGVAVLAMRESRNVLFGDDQQMDGSGGMDILEDLDSLVFKNSGRWYVVSDDLAKIQSSMTFSPQKFFVFSIRIACGTLFPQFPRGLRVLPVPSVRHRQSNRIEPA